MNKNSSDFIYLFLNEINVVLYDMIMKENYSDDNFRKLDSIISVYYQHIDNIEFWKTLILNEVMRVTHYGGKQNILEYFKDFFSEIISIESFLPYFNNVTKIDIDDRLKPAKEILVIKKILDDTNTSDIIRRLLVQKIQYLLITSCLYLTDETYQKIYEEVTSIVFDSNVAQIYEERFVFYLTLNSEDKKIG